MKYSKEMVKKNSFAMNNGLWKSIFSKKKKANCLSCHIWYHKTTVCFEQFCPQDIQSELKVKAGYLTLQSFASE